MAQGTRPRLPDQRRLKNIIYLQYKSRAAKKGYLFALSFSEFTHLISLPCYYCGTPPANFLKTATVEDTLIYQGIDRVENRLGYIIENSVPCCKTCNSAKGTMSHNEFMEFITRIYRYSIQRLGAFHKY